MGETMDSDLRHKTHAAAATQVAVQAPVRIAVVVPCYRERRHILDVLGRIGPTVSDIVVVDDGCPDKTGAYVDSVSVDARVRVVWLPENHGVGAATLAGYRAALAEGADLIVKLDGDGQMDPALIAPLIAPLLAGRADYTKGNRFHDVDGVRTMPATRLIGNVALSFLNKLSSGYWSVFDPTNGFTAIQGSVARQLPVARIQPRYFFESDLLHHLYLMGAVVEDVPMRAHYGDETSGIDVARSVPHFFQRHLSNMARRIFYAYFLRDFTAASIELVLGLALLVFGTAFGIHAWRDSIMTGEPATAGTVILAALPVILGFQFLLAFIDFDSRSAPKSTLHNKLL
ncbi:MAG: glycosyltransferase family 2 protein [Proteobacteria bacterium]|nr:glycosyltransferase family 2 protein [Pseudomonadota bacterium]